jgi:hypothetical protein
VTDPNVGEDQISVRVADATGEESCWQLGLSYEGDGEGDSNGEEYLLSLSDPVNGRAWSARGPDMFDALCALRRQLEPLGMRICVSGARVDVYPSGMSRDMGGGQMAYVLGKPGRFGRLLRFHVLHIRRPGPLVDIFSPAPCDLVATVADQERYFQEWVDRGLGTSRTAAERG